MASELQLDPLEVERLLGELRRRLESAGVSARIHIVGGSAMALHFPDDSDTRMTQDIDAAFQPADEVRRVIEQMAADMKLSPTWMNASASAFMPPRRDERGSSASVDVTVATINELIAMKLAASREQDLHDLGILARNAGITDPQRLVDIAFEAYGEHSVVLNDTREDYLIMARQALAGARRRVARKRGRED